MTAGPELDRLTCEALGIAPLTWVRVDDLDQAISDPYPESSRETAELLGGVEVPHSYPPVSSDWAAMKLVWDALVARKIEFYAGMESVFYHSRPLVARVQIFTTASAETSADVYAIAVPEALCLATLAALGVKP